MPSRTPDPRDARIREALALRRWALPALCGAGGAAPAASREGWTTFLRTERCARPLLALGEGALGTGAASVRLLAGIETQRMLSAAAQLKLFAGLARREGGSVVVLKGGVPLAQGRPGVDLVDVDVLAAPAEAGALGAALDAAGYAKHGRDSAHRLAERAAPDAVQVEIHTAVPGIGSAETFLGRAVPTRTAGLRVPHPADHLWHLLLHTVAQHTGRRGCLRELVLMADGLAAVDADDLAGLRARTRGRRDAPALLAQLELAEALRDRRPPAADPFAEVAAGMYAVTEYLAPLEIASAVKAGIAETAMQSIARRAGTLPALRDMGEGLEQGGPLGRLLRRVPVWAFSPPALYLVRRAERAARAA